MDAIPVLDWYEHGKGESTICCHSPLYLSFPSLSVIPAKAGTQIPCPSIVTGAPPTLTN